MGIPDQFEINPHLIALERRAELDANINATLGQGYLADEADLLAKEVSEKVSAAHNTYDSISQKGGHESVFIERDLSVRKGVENYVEEYRHRLATSLAVREFLKDLDLLERFMTEPTHVVPEPAKHDNLSGAIDWFVELSYSDGPVRVSYAHIFGPGKAYDMHHLILQNPRSRSQWVPRPKQTPLDPVEQRPPWKV
jgi:hypothetical protein